MGVDMVRMPPEISRGFVQVLGWHTDVVKFAGSDAEERVRTREMPELRWQASKGIFTAARLDEFVGFMRARAGSLHGFRFVDLGDCSTNPTDLKGAPSALDQFIGYGDGTATTFELRRTYESTADDLPQRLAIEDRFLPIHGETDDRLAKCLGLPLGTTFNVLVAIDGTPQPTGWTINLRTRSITFDTAPASGSLVTFGCYYDWAVRLDEDADASFESIRESWNSGNVPNIPLVGIPFTRMTPETDDPGGARELEWASGTPVLNKFEGRVVELSPQATGLSVALQDPQDLNYGGPHLILLNTSGTYDVDVVDEMTGSAIATIGTSPSSTGGLLCFVRGTGTARAWFAVQVAH